MKYKSSPARATDDGVMGVAGADTQRHYLLDVAHVLREFVLAPLETASLAPSSGRLAAAMVTSVPEQGEPVVVELGPGTGTFTSAIQRKLGGHGHHLAVELNPRWADQLRRRYPGVEVVNADARELPQIMADRGLRADTTVSGLPWIGYGPDDESSLPQLVADILTDTGTFTQFAYSWTLWAPPARRLLRDLRTTFADLSIGHMVWGNFPPARVYLARGPQSLK